ncbi:MAG: class I tRNA ligase family protein [Coriobacteriales bacterium]|jgi:methionyl-tRNA synthetase|nr:class I tRNA ligase family protein [Coriobacteriales bacterium]
MRPTFPRRAIITAGMPYANKGLHFGHIGGVFVPADCYARFLRDRIGSANVLFVSGTDCYGSPIDEGYRKLVKDGFAGSIEDYVLSNHRAQVKALRCYDISLDIFEGSGLGKCKDVHARLSSEIICRMYGQGWLEPEASAQFFDEQVKQFLNGRQVLGHCPVQGCKSRIAYADECELGHQYRPQDLCNPISSVTGSRPELVAVTNWYLRLPEFSTQLRAYVQRLRLDERVRPLVTNTIAEFLQPPIMYVKQEFYDVYQALAPRLPQHSYRPVEKGKASFELEFDDLANRDAARDQLEAAHIRLRTGKTLVPFRLTGNVAWGVPAPAIEGIQERTIWCWPESLWAPISFSRCWLENQGEGVESLNPASAHRVQGNWEDFWQNPESQVYQFIGQDNIYFYGIAQTALWAALARQSGPDAVTAPGNYQQTLLVANYHLLFMDKKASSSGTVKPPTALELLEHYQSEELRIHFLSLGLGLKPVNFQPKAFNPAAVEGTPDPVLKESALLTNVFNRLARSCFYEAQRHFSGRLPLADLPGVLKEDATTTILAYEQAMYRTELHTATQLASDFIRRANKYWSEGIQTAGEDLEQRRQVLAGSFYLLRVATVLMHPIVPGGTQLIFQQLNFDISVEDFFSWEKIFLGNEIFFTDEDIQAGGHPVRELPPRFDFFARHPSQQQRA